MATRPELVNEMLDEFGKQSSDARQKVDRWVGSVTVDLLSQSEGRFAGLTDEQDITIGTSGLEHKLDSNFNTAQDKSLVLDSNGEFVRDFNIVSHNEYYRRKADPETYPGSTFAMIRNKAGAQGLGYYLIMGTAPTETFPLKFLYYRKATGDDTDIINNPEIARTGVRAKAKEFNLDYQTDDVIYFRMRSGFKPSIGKTAPNMVMKPSEKHQDLNKVMYDIGGGG